VVLAGDQINLSCSLHRGHSPGEFGDLPGALTDLGDSMRLDPTNPWTLNLLSGALEQAGRKAEAVDRAREGVTLAPSYWRNHQTLGFALSSLERWTEAAASYDRACQLSGAQLPCSLWAVALWKAGRAKEAKAAADAAQAMLASDWGTYNLACYAALSGDRKKAIAFLRTASGLRVPADPATDADLTTLRGDTAFTELLPTFTAPSP